VFWTQGRYSEAEGLYKRALAILEKALGANHPDVGWTLNDLALVYRGQGRYGEAEGLNERALAILEKALGASHAQVGQALNDLGNVYRDQGKYVEAEEFLKRALAIREKALGTSHPRVAVSLANLANVYHHINRWPRRHGLPGHWRVVRQSLHAAERTAPLQRHPLHSVRNPTMGAANKIRRKN
jgi:tetratricopeptide (TPR) repeat protein